MTMYNAQNKFKINISIPAFLPLVGQSAFCSHPFHCSLHGPWPRDPCSDVPPAFILLPVLSIYSCCHLDLSEVKQWPRAE